MVEVNRELTIEMLNDDIFPWPDGAGEPLQEEVEKEDADTNIYICLVSHKLAKDTKQKLFEQ